MKYAIVVLLFVSAHYAVGQDFLIGMKYGLLRPNNLHLSWNEDTDQDRLTSYPTQSYAIFFEFSFSKNFALASEVGTHSQAVLLQFKYDHTDFSGTRREVNVHGRHTRGMTYFGLYPEARIPLGTAGRIFINCGLELNQIQSNQFDGSFYISYAQPKKEYADHIWYQRDLLTEFSIGAGMDLLVINQILVGGELRYLRSFGVASPGDRPGIELGSLAMNLRIGYPLGENK